jgi:hypothetical protein
MENFRILRDVNWTLVALRLLFFVQTVVDVTVSGTKRAAKLAIEYTRPNEWLFFDGSAIPVPGWKFQEGKAGSAEVAWRFCPDTCSFYHEAGQLTTERINWLSAEVKYNNISLYSLDEFIERVRYFGNESPSPSVLLGAWSVLSGVVLSQTLGLTLAVIDENGEEKTFPAGSTVPIVLRGRAATPAVAHAPAPAPAANPTVDLSGVVSDCSAANVIVPASTERTNEIIYRRQGKLKSPEDVLFETDGPAHNATQTARTLDEMASRSDFSPFVGSVPESTPASTEGEQKSE